MILPSPDGSGTAVLVVGIRPEPAGRLAGPGVKDFRPAMTNRLTRLHVRRENPAGEGKPCGAGVCADRSWRGGENPPGRPSGGSCVGGGERRESDARIRSAALICPVNPSMHAPCCPSHSPSMSFSFFPWNWSTYCSLMIFLNLLDPDQAADASGHHRLRPPLAIPGTHAPPDRPAPDSPAWPVREAWPSIGDPVKSLHSGRKGMTRKNVRQAPDARCAGQCFHRQPGSQEQGNGQSAHHGNHPFPLALPAA